MKNTGARPIIRCLVHESEPDGTEERNYMVKIIAGVDSLMFSETPRLVDARKHPLRYYNSVHCHPQHRHR